MNGCGPTPEMSSLLHAFLIVMNVIQAIGIAYVTQRAVRKNREDKNGNGHKTE